MCCARRSQTHVTDGFKVRPTDTVAGVVTNAPFALRSAFPTCPFGGTRYADAHPRLDLPVGVAAFSSRRPARIRAEAATGDGPVARKGDARVQERDHDRPRRRRPRTAAAAAARDCRDHRCSPRARHRLATHEASGPAPFARRRGAAGRALSRTPHKRQVRSFSAGVPSLAWPARVDDPGAIWKVGPPALLGP